MKAFEVQIFDTVRNQTIKTIVHATSHSEAQRVARMQFPNGRVLACVEKR